MLKGRSGNALKCNIISFLITLSLLNGTEGCQTKGKLTEEIDGLLFPQDAFETKNGNGTLILDDPTNRFDASDCKSLFVRSANIFVFHGGECNSVPRKVDNIVLYRTTKFSIKWTNITILTNNAFSTWKGIKHLDISENSVLDTLAGGCFYGLHDLEKLWINDNKRLKSLEEDTFAFLSSLIDLSLAGNNILKVHDATKGLRALTVPSLQRLDLSGNPFDTVEEQDFDTVSQLNLKTLVLKDVDLKRIDPKSLSRLTSLNDLQLGSKRPTRSYIDLLKTINDDRNLSALSVYNVDLLDKTDTLVRILTHRSYRSITLKGVRVDKLDIDQTITVRNLEHFEISDSFMKEFPIVIFNSELFPSLNKIVMKRNKFYFPFPQHNSTVKLIDLSHNEIGIIPYESFSFAPLLEVLVLRDAVNSVRNYAFAVNSQLIFLDLSHNELKNAALLEFNEKTFLGLENLEALDLSFSKIKAFGNRQVFKGLSNLKFLSLRGNRIENFDVELVKPLKCLTKLDLRQNSFLVLDSSLMKDSLNELGLFSTMYKVDERLKEMIIQMTDIDRDTMYGNCTNREIIVKNENNQIFNLTIEPLPENEVARLCRITFQTNYPPYDETTPSDGITSDVNTSPVVVEQDDFEFFYILFRPIYVYDSLSFDTLSVIRFFYVFSFYLILFSVVTFIAVKAITWLSRCNKRKHQALIFDEKIDYCGIENKAYTVPYEKMKQDKSP